VAYQNSNMKLKPGNFEKNEISLLEFKEKTRNEIER